MMFFAVFLQVIMPLSISLLSVNCWLLTKAREPILLWHLTHSFNEYRLIHTFSTDFCLKVNAAKRSDSEFLSQIPLLTLISITLSAHSFDSYYCLFKNYHGYIFDNSFFFCQIMKIKLIKRQFIEIWNLSNN